MPDCVDLDIGELLGSLVLGLWNTSSQFDKGVAGNYRKVDY